MLRAAVIGGVALGGFAIGVLVASTASAEIESTAGQECPQRVVGLLGGAGCSGDATGEGVLPVTDAVGQVLDDTSDVARSLTPVDVGRSPGTVAVEVVDDVTRAAGGAVQSAAVSVGTVLDGPQPAVAETSPSTGSEKPRDPEPRGTSGRDTASVAPFAPRSVSVQPVSPGAPRHAAVSSDVDESGAASRASPAFAGSVPLEPSGSAGAVAVASGSGAAPSLLATLSPYHEPAGARGSTPAVRGQIRVIGRNAERPSVSPD